MYKGTILQYLRKYIKDLQADQLESHLLSGECTLHAIELEPDAISDWIADVLPYTTEIEKVFCSKVSIKIPWAQIMTKPLVISIQQMEVSLMVHDFRDQEWAVSQAAEQKNKLIQTRMTDSEKVEDPDKTLRNLELSWIDYVSAGIQVRVEFCKLDIFSDSTSRIPSSVPHSGPCPTETPSSSSSTPCERTLAFSMDLEGVFIAPCHFSSGWSVSYVDNPDHVYHYDGSDKTLRLSRLVTLKSFTVNDAVSKQPLITHSPGFRMRLSSAFACVNLSKGKGKRRFCIPPFPSSSDSAIWLDRVNFSTSCSCQLAAFYALLQDLLAPVIVPAESLTSANRPHHFTYNEEDILRAKNQAELEALFAPKISREPSPMPEPVPVDTLAPLPPLPVIKKKGVVRGANVAGKDEIKKLFFGLAKEVRTNANKATWQAQKGTDKIFSSGKQIFTSAISGITKVGSKTTKSSALSPNSVAISPQEAAAGSPANSSPTRNRVESVASSSIYSSASDFVDAISGDEQSEDASPLTRLDEDLTGLKRGPSGAVLTGPSDGFAMWAHGGTQEGGEFELEAQLVVMDKICYRSFFHFHANEIGLISCVRKPDGSADTVSIIARRLDMTSESMIPLTIAQLSVLAAFSQSPDLFLQHAKRITANVLCPLEPVHSCTALSTSLLEITVTPPPTSPESQTTILKILNPNNPGMKSLSLKWKSRTPPPTRLIAGSSIESGRIQPYEGCIHGIQISSDQWSPFIAMYNQIMAHGGEFPDPSLDPVMRMRLCVRDAELVATPGWRISLPSGIMSRNFPKSGAGFVDLLAGFQTLTAVPECHYVESAGEGEKNLAPGFPHDSAFCSCICGQETTSWSWALPTMDPRLPGQYPTRIKLPGRVLGSTGTVTERSWKKSQVDDAKNFVYVPVEEFATLLETKLKVAEQQVVLDQVREQYVSVMEEMTKRNIFLKERWAADAVHAGSKETVVEILTQKVCVLEKLVREMQDTKEADDKAIHELRSVCAKEMAEARKELLEQTQTLKFKIADTAASTDGLQEMIAQKDKEIEELKSQREFLLGLGVKSSTHMSMQTENFS